MQGMCLPVHRMWMSQAGSAHRHHLPTIMMHEANIQVFHVNALNVAVNLKLPQPPARALSLHLTSPERCM